MLSKENLVLELKEMGILNPVILNAIKNTPRELFIDAEKNALAYENIPVSIDCAQTISQPYIVAQMTQLLIGESSLPLSKILEIGTGSGYQAAILSQFATQVYSIERYDFLYKKSKTLLSSMGYENIKLKHGDGFKGWKEHAPFDAIIVTAAPSTIPVDLLDQLSENNGRMVIPVGDKTNQELQLIIRHKEECQIKNIEAVRFVPMLSGKK
jgi:protein-L-isoaspartate(D-aspartate) O-methyltransferase